MPSSRRRGGRCALVPIVALAAALGAPAAGAAPQSEDPVTLKRASIPKCPAREAGMHVGGSRRISLRCKGLNKVRAEIVRQPRHGALGKVSQKRDRVRYRPDARYHGPDYFVVERELDGRSYRTSLRLEVGQIRGLDCEDHHMIARSNSPVEVHIHCHGKNLGRLGLARGPTSGEIDGVRHRSRGREQTLTARYTPDEPFSGQEAVVVEAGDGEQSTFGSIGISVLPWRMRALGDSVTAGFGYYGDPAHNGFEMSASELPDCKPGAVVTNRCSSNSDARGGYTGPPEWNADFGLANNVSWAAQFANGIQGGGVVTAPDMFQNRAVTGSAPSDWLPGGILNDELKAIVSEDPELIAMTLGANPLLTDLLLTVGGEECADTDTADELRSCLAPFFEQVQLTERLQQVYTVLLGAEHSTVVVFQYHLAVPAANLFETWQLEVMIDFFNEQISTAVANTRAAVSSQQAARLIMIPTQVDPNAPAPGLLPRFNIGLPPDGQTWSPGYDCGDDDFVDGPSHQSEPTQDEFEVEHPFEYCEGDEWIIGADSGIHPSRDGYAQFATTLAAVSEANGLIPRLP